MNQQKKINDRLKSELEKLGAKAPNNISLFPAQPLHYQCNVCDDMGIVKKNVPVDHPDFGKAFDCPNPDCVVGRENARRRLANKMGHVGIPPKFKVCTFDTWDALPDGLKRGKVGARAVCETFVEMAGEAFSLAQCHPHYQGKDEPKLGFVLEGSNGLGKTGLLAAVGNALIEMQVPVLYLNTLELFREIKRTFDDADNSTADLMDTIKNTPVLLLDELYLETNAFHRETMDEIVRYRHGRNLPMCFTTNVKRVDGDYSPFEAMWHSRTATAIFEHCHWIPLGGEVIRHEGYDQLEVF